MEESEFGRSDEMPARVVDEALNEGSASAVEHQGECNEEHPTCFHVIALQKSDAEGGFLALAPDSGVSY